MFFTETFWRAISRNTEARAAHCRCSAYSFGRQTSSGPTFLSEQMSNIVLQYGSINCTPSYLTKKRLIWEVATGER